MATKTDTEQERALLPCPFCGGEPSITKQMDESPWSHDIVLWTQVECDGCEAHVGPTCEGFEVEAVDIWNRRAALQSQPLTVDALAQEIRRVDGGHSLGAGALAEALMPFLASALQLQDKEDAERFRFCLEHGFPQKWEEMIKGNFRHYWTSRPGSQEEFSSAIEAIDHARRVEREA